MWIRTGYLGWMAGVVVALFAWTASAVPAATQPAETPPDRIIRVQKGAGVTPLGFTQDGKSVYLWCGVSRVNVWRVMVYYWPEAVAIALFALMLWRIRRMIGRRQVAGEEYCRGCNYNLRGLAGERCPECGKSIVGRGRVRGGRWGLRLVLWASASIAVIGLFGLERGRAPRVGRVSGWFEWYSMGLAEWGEKLTWVNRHKENAYAIFLGDLETARVRRVCWIVGETGDTYGFPVLSGDKQYVFAAAGTQEPMDGSKLYTEWREIVQFEMKSGRIIRRLDARSRDIVVSPTREARILIARTISSVGAWDVRTGRKLAEFQDRSLRGSTISAEAVIDGDIVLISSKGRDKDMLNTWDPNTGQVNVSFDIPDGWRTVDRSRIFLLQAEDAGLFVDALDAMDGHKLDRFRIAGTDVAPLCIYSGGGLLAVTVGNEIGLAVSIIDPAKRVQIRFISAGNRSPVAGMISPDGRRVVFFDPLMSQIDPAPNLRVYDLPSTK